mgnify:FL=1
MSIAIARHIPPESGLELSVRIVPIHNLHVESSSTEDDLDYVLPGYRAAFYDRIELCTRFRGFADTAC